MAFLKNNAKCLWQVAGVSISPTAAVEVPDSALEWESVKRAIKVKDLEVVKEAVEPVIVDDPLKDEKKNKK